MKFLEVIKFLQILIKQRKMFIIWGIVLGISAIGPVLNIYLVTELINNVAEEKEITQTIIILLVGILAVDFFDNVLRLLSKTRLGKICYAIEIETQLFLLNIVSPSKVSRERMIKAISNLTEALRELLVFIKENGIGAITRFVAIPVILFGLDPKIFIIEIVYIVFYFFIDWRTTRRYQKKIDVVNEKLEGYFEGIINGHKNPPKKRLLKAISKRENFSFWEWSFLQHLSKFVYFVIILISVFEIVNGEAEIGILLLYTGYISQTQSFLNTLSSLFDRITNVHIGLQRISKEGDIEVSYILDNISSNGQH